MNDVISFPTTRQQPEGYPELYVVSHHRNHRDPNRLITVIAFARTALEAFDELMRLAGIGIERRRDDFAPELHGWDTLCELAQELTGDEFEVVSYEVDTQNAAIRQFMTT